MPKRRNPGSGRTRNGRQSSFGFAREGWRAVGMRTPSWDFGPNTLALEQETGLFYGSSLIADEDCYEPLLHGEEARVVELSVE